MPAVLDERIKTGIFNVGRGQKRGTETRGRSRSSRASEKFGIFVSAIDFPKKMYYNTFIGNAYAEAVAVRRSVSGGKRRETKKKETEV